MKNLYKNVVEGDFADYNNGVCFDRVLDHEGDGLDFLPFYQKVFWGGADTGTSTWVDAVMIRYLEKYEAFVKAVQGNVMTKTKKKGDGSAHLESAGVDELLQRMRGFEKCRDYVGLVDRKMAQTCRFRVGKQSGKWFSEDEIKDAKPNSQGQKILVSKCVPEYSFDSARALKGVMTEGDDCCQENCEKGDSTCRPCAPACKRDAKGRVSCDVERPFCFEDCKDEDGNRRVCTGLKSMARWAAKELKVTLSFDTCPELDSDKRWDLKNVKDQRNLLERQYCGLFDPTSKCHVKLDQLLMRGDAESHWSAEQSNENAIACEDTSSMTGDAQKRSRDLVSWALKKAVQDNDDVENGKGKTLSKGTGSGVTSDAVEKGKIKEYFIPQGTDPDTVGLIVEADDEE